MRKLPEAEIIYFNSILNLCCEDLLYSNLIHSLIVDEDIKGYVEVAHRQNKQRLKSTLQFINENDVIIKKEEEHERKKFQVRHEQH